jgi:hypothetical protein
MMDVDSENQTIINNYKKYVIENPKMLIKTEAFTQIETYYQQILNEQIDRDTDRDNSINTLFDTNNVSLLNNYMSQERFSKPLDITLHNNADSNLYYAVTKILWYAIPRCFDVDATLNINVIKEQVGKDLHRSNMSINNGPNLDLAEFAEFSKKSNNVGETDYFNLMLMDIIKEQKFPINMNTINLIDLCRIQQCIQFCLDAMTVMLTKKNMSQGGEAGQQNTSLTYNIVLNPTEQYIETMCSSPTLQFTNEGNILVGGNVTIWFKTNISDLTYSLRILFDPPKPETQDFASEIAIPQENRQSMIQEYTNRMSDIGKGTINYAKNNPAKVATGIGAAAVLGSTAGILMLAGLLGGKSSYLRNKNTKKKTKKTKKPKKKTKNAKKKTKNTKKTAKNCNKLTRQKQ